MPSLRLLWWADKTTMPKIHDIQRRKLRRLMMLVSLFAFLPSGLLLTVGVLILVLGHATKDVVFGIITLGLTVTLLGGVALTVIYVRRETSVAQLQTEFVNKVSHDLRTPLTSIRLFVETLQGGRLQDPDKVQQALDTIATETARLTNMIDRLLGWARIEAGKRVYRQTPTPARAVVEAALQAFEPQLLTATDVQLATHIADDLPTISVDLPAMSEALLNLLQNAFHYTGPHKVITVRCFRRGTQVVISVSDNGPGIPKHEHRRVFEKFYRLTRDDLARQPQGTGLGLSMVHHIVRAHDGMTTVDSELGQGATFSIALPSLAPSLPETVADRSPTEPPPVAPAR
jgi:two-component system phosphate regulon sensor histidine kinase PhoR